MFKENMHQHFDGSIAVNGKVIAEQENMTLFLNLPQ